MVEENKDQHDAKAHLYLEEARWRRDDQIRRLDALERKLVTAFTLNVSMIAIFGASLGIAGGPFSLAVECLVYSTVFLFVIGLGFATRAYLGAAWNRAPDLDILQQLLGRFDDDTITQWIADAILVGLAENEQTLDQRSRTATYAVLFAACTATMVGVTAAAHLGSGAGV